MNLWWLFPDSLLESRTPLSGNPVPPPAFSNSCIFFYIPIELKNVLKKLSNSSLLDFSRSKIIDPHGMLSLSIARVSSSFCFVLLLLVVRIESLVIGRNTDSRLIARSGNPVLGDREALRLSARERIITSADLFCSSLRASEAEKGDTLRSDNFWTTCWEWWCSRVSSLFLTYCLDSRKLPRSRWNEWMGEISESSPRLLENISFLLYSSVDLLCRSAFISLPKGIVFITLTSKFTGTSYSVPALCSMLRKEGHWS